MVTLRRWAVPDDLATPTLLDRLHNLLQEGEAPVQNPQNRIISLLNRNGGATDRCHTTVQIEQALF